jgi:hypothetical protein
MQNASNVSKTDTRKPYSKPLFTQMSKEEARTFLLERANRGQQGAREMLELMFPDAKKASATKGSAQR